MHLTARKGFTLVELLVVIAILAIILVVVVSGLNPAQLLKQGRDTTRLSDAATLRSAIGIYAEDVKGNLGSSSVVYISIPDPAATSSAGDQCQGLGLPAVASTTYHCASPSTFRNIDGTGWIPVNLKSVSFGTPISNLPVDPVNTTSSGEYYTYETNGSLYENTMALEATKSVPTQASDTGQYTDLYEQGTSLNLAPTDFYLHSPAGAATQSVWVADRGNNRVEQFNASGGYLSQFGTSGAGNGQFASPSGITTDPAGNIYVVDQYNYRVQKFNASGAYLSQFGSFGSGNGQFEYPAGGIAIDPSGNIWVVDYYDYRIEEFSATGTYLNQFGSYGTSGTNGKFVTPSGIAIDPSGNIYIGDANTGYIEEFNSSTIYLSNFGGPGTGNGQFSFGNGPGAIVIDGVGNLWITDQGNNRVEEFNSSGTYLSQFGSYGTGNGQLHNPSSMAIDAAGNFWIGDYSNNRVEEFSSGGTYLSTVGTAGSGSGQLSIPLGVVIK